MNHSMFRLLTIALSIFMIGLFTESVAAQGNGNGGGKGGGGDDGGGDPPPPFTYQIEYANLPAGITNLYVSQIKEVNGEIVAVGRMDIDGQRRGFIYNSTTQTTFDVYQQSGLETSCRAINADGIVIGNAVDALGEVRVYWLDTTLESPVLNYVDQQFPNLPSGQRAEDINIHGDILIETWVGDENYATVVNPTADSSFELDVPLPKRITDSGFVLGGFYNGAEYVAVRWSFLTGYETLVGFKVRNSRALNEIGDFGAIFETNSSDIPCRVSSQIDWTGAADNAYLIGSLNNTNDLTYGMGVTIGKGREKKFVEKGFLYHAGVDLEIALDDLVTETFFNAGRHLGVFMTERDETLSSPAPVIGGAVTDDNGDWRVYFLFPVE